MCVRRCPTFPPGLGSIIGAGRLSFRVRDGSGRFPAAMSAVTLFTCVVRFVFGGGVWLWCGCGVLVVVSFRPVSASSLTYCYGCRSGLLIPWSAGGLIPLVWVRSLVLEGVSRLDAFSGYPVRTWRSSRAPGGTTGRPEVRPSRSSRTRDRFPQASDARGG